MNIAKMLVTKIVDEQKLRPMLSAGFHARWLRDPNSRVVFDGQDREIYLRILEHYDKYAEVPDRDQIHELYDPTYKFSESDRSFKWLMDRAGQLYHSGLADEFAADFVDLFDQEDVDGAVERARQLIRKVDAGINTAIDEESFGEMLHDFLDRIDEEKVPGIPMGIPSFDENFGGMQPGQLITLIGRQKAAKTWHLIKMALAAWHDGSTSLLYSVELNKHQIEMRLVAAEAQVSYDKLRKHKPEHSERRRIEAAVKHFMDEDDVELHIMRLRDSLTVADVAAGIQRHSPHIVFIDGFYFMYDTETGKSGTDWKAHENLAAQLKVLAEQEEVVIVVTTQVQEKQYNSKAGVEARSISGGTGLLKASDLVIGVDAPDDLDNQALSMLLNRESAPIKTCVRWDWQTMEFEEVEGANYSIDDEDFDL